MLKPLSNALTSAGVPNEISEQGQSINIQPRDYANLIELSERSTGRYDSTPKYWITIGMYGNRVRFPAKRDGSFNVAGIVAKIVERRAAAQRTLDAQNTREAMKKAADAFAAQVSEEIGRKVVGSSDRGFIAKAGHVLLPLYVMELTPEQAKIMHDALTAIGK